jgi:hypothetical protein
MANNLIIMGTPVYIDDEDALLAAEIVSYINKVYNDIEAKQMQNGGRINSNTTKALVTFFIAKKLYAMKGNNEAFQDKNIKKVESLISFIDSIVLPEQ